MNRNEVFAFEVSVAGEEWSRVVNARSAGAAKSWYHRDISDAYPDLPFTLLRVRKVGKPHTCPEFIRNAQYRGMPGLRCGQRVIAEGGRGVVVGHNSSANLDVLFDDDSPRYAGQRLNVHPAYVRLESHPEDRG